MTCNNTEIINERRAIKKPQTSNNTYHPKNISNLRTAAYSNSKKDEYDSALGGLG